MWAWLSSNVAGSNKRAAATGVIFSVGNVGGIISGQIYRAEWAPRYVQGHAINLACYVIALVAGFILWLSYRNDNIARDKAEGRRVERTESMLGDDLGDLGDRYVSIACLEAEKSLILHFLDTRTSDIICRLYTVESQSYHCTKSSAQTVKCRILLLARACTLSRLPDRGK